MLKPIGPYILVKPFPKEGKKTKSGLIINDYINDNMDIIRGTILSLGTGLILSSGIRTEFNCNVNDIVLYKEYVGTKIEYNNEVYTLLLEGDILCIDNE